MPAGLTAGSERKNGWTLAEHTAQIGPDGMQRLLRRADCDRDGVLIVDDTGFLVFPYRVDSRAQVEQNWGTPLTLFETGSGFCSASMSPTWGGRV
ncbi:hypothetical protein GCM10018954_037990 [Kutzneria kofuensis]